MKDPEEAKRALEGFLRGWVESDRVGALNYAFDNQSDPAVEASFASMLQRSFQNGSREDNDSLVTRLESEGLLEGVAMEISRPLVFMQPEIGLRLAESIKDPQDRLQQQQTAIGSWARRDYNKARDYFDGLESVETRAKLLPSLSGTLASRSDGGAQLVSLMESIPEGKERSESIETILTNATRPRAKLSDDYIEGLQALLEAEPELSEKAKALRGKLPMPKL
ncbi:hypothetical protein [Pelagicoccus sp. SDUM812002]|uniref:hypothetical protein n=1 Tax=Pelagicoccus sp. SDUM812002 TaxID=3041266 RepID=UPI00281081A3|nr:hypothetical protein [Pelagicoccus sp. SDUM812002]MDQ8186820.1 hypothetical protein [Pelagicoccus sp. SDUM812002]